MLLDRQFTCQRIALMALEVRCWVVHPARRRLAEVLGVDPDSAAALVATTADFESDADLD